MTNGLASFVFIMASLDKNTIDYFTNLFSRSQSNDNETRESATNEINRMFSEEPMKCIYIFSNLMQGVDSVPLGTRRLSAILLARVLRPYSPEMMMKIRDYWNNPDHLQLILNLKDALFKTVLDDDVIVRNNSCNVFGLVFSIENGTWIDALQQIVNNIGNTQIADIGRVGLFRIFIEILVTPNFKSELRKQNLEGYYIQIFMAALDVVKTPINQENKSVELRTVAASCIYYTLLNMSDYFENRNLEEIIPTILNSLIPSFQIQNLELFQGLHKIMFVMIEQFYKQSINFIQMIMKFTYNGMGMFNLPDYQNIAIYTWQEIAELEHRKKKKNQAYDSFLCEICLDNLANAFITIMASIPKDDIEVEDISNPKPSMYAASALQSIYKVIPQQVFNKCFQPLKEYITSEDWVKQHTGLLLLYCITEDPKFPDHLVPLIQDAFPYVIEYCKPNHCNHLRETALFLLGFLLKQYKEFISDKKYCKNPQEVMDQILSVIVITNDSTDPQIIQRYAMIIYHLSEAWEGNKYNSLIGLYFPKMYGYLYNMLQYTNYIIEKNTRQSSTITGLISTIFESMNMLFLSVPEENLDECLNSSGLYEDVMNRLRESSNIFQSSEIIFAFQAGLCSNLSTMTLRLKKKVSSKVQQAIAILFNILQQRNSLIYEEGIMGLAAIVFGCTDSINDEILIRLTKIADDGLHFDSPNVICASSILLSDLFKYFKGRMEPIVDNSFTVLYKLIMDHPEMKDIHPYVIRTMAQMFDSLYESHDCLERYKVQYIELLSRVKTVSFSLNFDIKADVEYANALYRSLADAYASYAKNFYATLYGNGNDPENIQLERKQLLEFADFSNCILQIGEYNIDDELIQAFIGAARQFANNCSRKNNVILNRNKIHQVLDIGSRRTTSKITNLSKKSKEASKYLKSK